MLVRNKPSDKYLQTDTKAVHIMRGMAMQNRAR